MIPVLVELREFLRLLRYAQASLSVAYHARDLERSRNGLAKALAARDGALAAIRAAENVPAPPPVYLLRQPAKVRPIKRRTESDEAALRG